tara:strand:- start:211 stop:609 length:399 start_codon:yes stop_codon:yes gene_type:complete
MSSSTAADLSLALYFANARIHQVLDEALSIRLGINFDDYVLLQSLADESDMELVRLATYLGNTRMGLLNKIRPLEKIGLLVSAGNVSQRQVRLTPAGQRTLNTAQQIVADDSNGMFGDEDLGGVLELVEKLN